MLEERYLSIRNSILHFLYQNILKRLFFLGDPERVHDSLVKIGNKLGRFTFGQKITSLAFGYENSMLEQTVAGIRFKNPIGLSAGFDKNAELTEIIPFVGFGFEEVGSITGEACKGNPKPRLWRLKDLKSLVVYYGLKNDGAEILSNKLRGKEFKFPVGISIAKTNSEITCDTEAGIQDYLKAYKAFQNIGDYFTINISCPNTFGGQPFTDREKLQKLLNEIDRLPKTKPIFIKLSPDLTLTEVDNILKVIKEHSIDGLIISNLTKNRNNPNIKGINLPPNGGFSGKVVEDLSNKLIEYVYSKTKGKYIIIGCGGVFTAEDAYKKIKLGASLIQMITGMIFEGPQVISQINLGLVNLLKKDGYSNISEAIGAYSVRPIKSSANVSL